MAPPGTGGSTPTAAACLGGSIPHASLELREFPLFLIAIRWRSPNFAWHSPRSDASDVFHAPNEEHAENAKRRPAAPNQPA